MKNFDTASEYLVKGAKLLGEGKVSEAITSLKTAVKLDSKLTAAYFDLALAYKEKNDIHKIINNLQAVVKLKSDDFVAQNLLGHYYNTQNKVDNAITCFQKAIKSNPLMVEAHYNLGICYMQKGNNKEALHHLNKSLKLNPNDAMAFSVIGEYWIGINPQKAAGYFKKVIQIDPNSETAVFNLAICLQLLGETEDSIIALERALKLNPNSPAIYGQLYHQVRDICDFEKAKKLEGEMRKLTTETELTSVIYDQNPKNNLKNAMILSQYVEEKIAPCKKSYTFVKHNINKPIRIGYLSSDFKNHATAHLMMGLFRNHNRKNFGIYTYSYGENDKSSYRQEIQKLTNFRDIINFSPLQAADLINKNGIDILVDLKGHTANSRLGILALKPAPIQVTWLGFPGTIGASFIDYLITDRIVTPKSIEKYFTEKLIFMPNTYQPTDNQQKVAADMDRHDFGLPENVFLFCSFNQPYKFEPNLFDSWSRILISVPNSALCLLAKNKPQIKNIIDEFKRRKIDPMRIIFAAHAEKTIHLARLALCDLSLDTFTYNGHTTTSDSLWVGVPVVALLGNHFASRVSASLLTAIGLPELVTHSQKEYESLTISLALNPQKLDAIRCTLYANRLTKPLFNTQLFVKNLEDAYVKMIQDSKFRIHE